MFALLHEQGALHHGVARNAGDQIQVLVRFLDKVHHGGRMLIVYADRLGQSTFCDYAAAKLLELGTSGAVFLIEEKPGGHGVAVLGLAENNKREFRPGTPGRDHAAEGVAQDRQHHAAESPVNTGHAVFQAGAHDRAGELGIVLSGIFGSNLSAPKSDGNHPARVHQLFGNIDRHTANDLLALSKIFVELRAGIVRDFAETAKQFMDISHFLSRLPSLCCPS